VSSPGPQSDGDARWGLAIGLVPALMLVAPRLLAWAWSDRMPDPIAVHWSLGGSPNGTMSLPASEVLSTAMGLLFWTIGIVMVRNARAWRVRRTIAASTAATIGFLSLLDVCVLMANLDQSTWQDAILPGWAGLLGFGGGALIGWGTWALCGQPPTIDVPAGAVPLTDAPPSAGLPPGARGATWEGSSANGWLGLLGIVLGGACIVAAPLVSAWLVLPGSVVLAACGTLAVLHVRCDARGLTVHYGLLGWPVQRIPLEDITVAHAIDLEPVEWGGWGYRWAPGQNGSAAVTRRGPAIVVERADGRRFAVTVDGAVTGAGVLNDLRLDLPGA
jgi:hypothetical protein